MHIRMQIYCGTLDQRLNENYYIVPGLSDAGTVFSAQIRTGITFKGQGRPLAFLLNMRMDVLIPKRRLI